jgi:hypothetical protein
MADQLNQRSEKIRWLATDSSYPKAAGRLALPRAFKRIFENTRPPQQTSGSATTPSLSTSVSHLSCGAGQRIPSVDSHFH